MFAAYGWFVRDLLTSDAVVGRGVGLRARDLSIPAARRQACGGHPGEPGC